MHLRTAAVLALVMFVAACTGAASTPPSPTRGSDELQILVSDLRSRGAVVQVKASVSEPFFTAPGRLVVVDGQEIRVLRFRSSSEASTAAAAVSSDGYSVGASSGGVTTVSQIDWISSPHFYRRGTLIVLYVGEDEATRQLLQAAMGPPFAGDA